MLKGKQAIEWRLYGDLGERLLEAVFRVRNLSFLGRRLGVVFPDKTHELLPRQKPEPDVHIQIPIKLCNFS